MSVACLSAPIPLRAQTITPRHYNIPAGQLAQALALFAEEAGISLSYDPLLVQGKSSPGLSGSYPVAAGFATLLSGSGLTAMFPVNGGVILQPAARSVAAIKAPPAELDSVLPVVRVTGASRDEDYSPADESLATGTAVPLQHIPQSVQVISSNLIRDQQGQTLADMIRNVAGTNYNPNTYGYGLDDYQIRGFDAPLLIDGLTYPGQTDLPAIAIDRVEVLKGAESTLAGDMPPSGLISVTTKQPQRKRVREIVLQKGSFGDVTTALDVGGTVPGNDTLLYRLVLSNEIADKNFGGYRGMKQLYIAPSMAWDDGNTRLVLGAQFARGNVPQRPYTIMADGHPIDLMHVIDNADEYSDFSWRRLYYQFSHKLSDGWTLRSNSSVRTQSATQYTYTVGQPNIVGDAYYLPQMQAMREQLVDTDNSVAGKFMAGNVEHRVVFGSAYSKFDGYQYDAYAEFYSLGNIFNPALPFPSADLESLITPNAVSTYRNLRIYAQDFMSVGKRWHFLATMGFHNARENGNAAQAWTPKFGVTRDLSDVVSVYGNYSRSLSLQAEYQQYPPFFPPSRGKTIEAGVKFNWPEAPLNISLSVFQATEGVIVRPDPGTGLNVLTPGARSHGVEFNLQGELLPGWKAIASYSYTSFQPTAGAVAQVPHHTASLWTTYAFRNPAWRNWGTGIGLYARSGYTGDGLGLGDFPMPGQTRTDLSLYYRDQGYSVTLGVRNVFDHRLYAGYATAGNVYPEPGRVVTLTAGYRF